MFLITYLVLPFVCSYILARYTPIIPIVDNKAPEKNEITKPVDINNNPMIDTSLFEEARLYFFMLFNKPI